MKTSSCRIFIQLEFSLQIFEKVSDIKFYQNPSRGSRVVARGRTDMTKLIDAFVILRTRLIRTFLWRTAFNGGWGGIMHHMAQEPIKTIQMLFTRKAQIQLTTQDPRSRKKKTCFVTQFYGRNVFPFRRNSAKSGTGVQWRRKHNAARQTKTLRVRTQVHNSDRTVRPTHQEKNCNSFEPLKHHLRHRCLQSNEETEMAVRERLRMKNTDSYRDETFKFMPRSHMCLDLPSRLWRNTRHLGAINVMISPTVFTIWGSLFIERHRLEYPLRRQSLQNTTVSCSEWEGRRRGGWSFRTKLGMKMSAWCYGRPEQTRNVAVLEILYRK